MAHDEPRVIDGIDPDESPTPLWFTVLGILLFVAVGLVLLSKSGDDEAGATASDVEEAGAGEPAAAAAPAPAAPDE